MAKHYTLKPQVTPLPVHSARKGVDQRARTSESEADAGPQLFAAGPGSLSDQPADDPFIRAEAEDDDGYDPYSDRPPVPEPLFQENPWD